MAVYGIIEAPAQEDRKMFIYIQMLDTPEEKSKFETIYIQNRELLFRIAYDILHHRQDAEDAVHQAFVKLAENMKKIGEPEDPATRGYIVTIVENKAIDIYRRKQSSNHLEYVDEMMGVQVPYSGDDALAECILMLPQRQQLVIIMKYSYGYNLHEIARMLRITYPNAQKLDQRAKTKLRELCKEKGIEW